MLMSDQKLRVGVRVTGGKQWIAGFHYLTNLFIAIRNANQNIQLVLYSAWETETSELDRFREFTNEIIEIPQRVWGRDDQMGPLLREKKLDCLFATADYGENLGIPQLAWLFDFQHKDMPELFPEKDLKIREEMFQSMADRANMLVLSSHHAAEACRKFYPEVANKIRVMPFVAHITDRVFESDPTDVLKKYNLPSKFVYLPNQFWKHKNHELVVDAVKMAAKTDPSLCVVCSGSTHDPRNWSYGPYLRSKIICLGLNSNIRLLGLIPEEDVFSLMRSSLCILQPSLYEGWSTVVEQAKSLGKPILLSNIQVHKEQRPSRARYFSTENPAELANLIVEAHSGNPGPDMESEAAGRAECQERSVEFGRKFRQIVEDTIASFQESKESPLTGLSLKS